jgi:hypothetical protein
MILTARQLQDLQGKTDQIVLPYGARLSPLAMDWARSRKLKIGYGPSEIAQTSAPPEIPAEKSTSPVPGGLLWWCDGPCGAAKAALAAQARESNLSEIDLPSEATQLTAAIKKLAAGVKAGAASGGILLVKSASEAVVYANRCKSLRAVVGTCLESVEQGISAVGANVIIVEYPHRSFSQIRNVLARFARGSKQPSSETQRKLEELASCT